MSQQRSVGTIVGNTHPNKVPHEAKASDHSRPRETTDGDKEAFDRERFPGDFYPGLILFLDRVRGRGVIRSYSGREIRFEFPFVTIVGAALGGRCPGIDLLHQGDEVGFDVGWTSKGLRVTKINPAS
jgi:hypothetical protein